MKECVLCGLEFQEKRSFEKYCSFLCCKKFQIKKTRERIRNDPEFRHQRNQKEYKRRKLKRQHNEEYRQKLNEAEKARYRRNNGINNDEDLKSAPKGSGTLTKYGYRQITKKDHPNVWKNGAMFEHVFVMSEYIGRALIDGETVHHKNGIRHDNRIDNLELWSHSHPPGQRVEDKIEWCKGFLEIYGYKVIIKKKH